MFFDAIYLVHNVFVVHISFRVRTLTGFFRVEEVL